MWTRSKWAWRSTVVKRDHVRKANTHFQRINCRWVKTCPLLGLGTCVARAPRATTQRMGWTCLWPCPYPGPGPWSWEDLMYLAACLNVVTRMVTLGTSVTSNYCRGQLWLNMSDNCCRGVGQVGPPMVIYFLIPGPFEFYPVCMVYSEGLVESLGW